MRQDLEDSIDEFDVPRLREGSRYDHGVPREQGEEGWLAKVVRDPTRLLQVHRSANEAPRRVEAHVDDWLIQCGGRVL